jgi:thioredoxin reductase (NADPH)
MTTIQRRRRRQQHYGSSPSALPLLSNNPGAGAGSNPTTQRHKRSVLHPLCLSASFSIVIILVVLAITRHTSQITSSSSRSSSQHRRFYKSVIKSQLTPSYFNVLDHPTTVFDVVVVGCGPAGLTASLYASRMGLSVLVIGSPSSGSLSGTDKLDNFPSFSDKGGQQWLDATMAQAMSFGTKFADPVWLATGLERASQSLLITLSKSNHDDATSQTLQTKSVIIATGSNPRTLGLPHEVTLWGRNIHNCAICDAELYSSRGKIQKSVAVIGGGDAALEAVSLLSRLGVANIHWIHRRNEFRARQSAVEKIRILPNVKIWQPFVVTEWVVNEIEGLKVLEGVRIVGSNVDGVADPEANSSMTIPCDGAFLMIGSKPNTNWLKKSGIVLDSTSGLIKLASSMDETPELPPLLSTSTSLAGVFAAGEVVDEIYRQALTASSDGAKAAMDVERYLRASSFEVAGVDVENVVAQDILPEISSDDAVQSYIDCDLTNVDCIKTLVAKHTVVVFSKPFCPYCRRALEALRSVMQNGESPFVVDLTEMGEVGWRVQQTLGELTGRRTVPNVFIRGSNIGGGDETVALHREGKLSRLITGDA